MPDPKLVLSKFWSHTSPVPAHISCLARLEWWSRSGVYKFPTYSSSASPTATCPTADIGNQSQRPTAWAQMWPHNPSQHNTAGDTSMGWKAALWLAAACACACAYERLQVMRELLLGQSCILEIFMKKKSLRWRIDKAWVFRGGRMRKQG